MTPPPLVTVQRGGAPLRLTAPKRFDLCHTGDVIAITGSVKQEIKRVGEVSIYLYEVLGFFAGDSGGAYQAPRRRG